MSSKIEPKTTPEEILTVFEAINDLQKCKHCRNNSKATQPFDEMKRIKLTPLSEKVLDQVAKQYSIKEETCLICIALEAFLKLPLNQQLEWLKERA